MRARRDTGDRDAPTPPPSLRPVLGFQRLPPRALRTVAEVLDRDETFRNRVAEGLAADEPDRASWLFLTRPDGWADELDLLGEGAAEQRAAKDRRSAERRVEQLSAALERRGEELEGQREGLDSLRTELAQERRRRHDAEMALESSGERTDALAEERARAVRELKRIEALAAERLDHLRAAEAELSELRTDLEALRSAPSPVSTEQPEPPRGAAEMEPSPPPSPLPEVAAAVEGAARSAGELAGALAEIAQLLSGTTARRASQPTPAGDPPPAEPHASASPVARPSRRVPLRTRRGVVEDSPEGIEQLMGIDGLFTLVDGYNVAMSRWPELDKGAQRDSLVRALGSLAARVGATVHVVFDGGDHGQRPAVGAPLPVRVHFSPTGVEADDVILAMVAELPTDAPVLVISSDRRVAQGSRRLGANTAGSDTLVGLLGR